MSNLAVNAAEVTSTLHVLYIQHYCQLAAFIIVFYDHLITFDSEVELIWQKRWSKSKVLYVLCRYVGDIFIFWETFVYFNPNPTHTAFGACDAWADWLVYVLGLHNFRIQALYNNRLLSKTLFCIFIGEVVGLVILGFLAVQGTEMTAEPLPGIRRCIQIKLPPNSFMFWVIILFFDTVLFLLALGMIIRSWQNWRKLSREAIRTRPSLAIILLRDNLSYFFFAFVLYLMTTITWLTADAQYFSIPSCFSYSVTTVLGCRLILNLCNAYHNPPSYISRGLSEWDTRPHWMDGSSSDHWHASMALTQNMSQEAGEQSREVDGGSKMGPDVGGEMEMGPVPKDIDDAHVEHEQAGWSRSSDLHIAFPTNI